MTINNNSLPNVYFTSPIPATNALTTEDIFYTSGDVQEPKYPKSIVDDVIGFRGEFRPWGYFEILYSAENCKVKKICIEPGQSPSYQYHARRKELWQIIAGHGILTLDDVESPVLPGDVIEIGFFQRHRIRNTGTTPLIFIEIQTGEYFGEDDIVRISDDYNRI